MPMNTNVNPRNNDATGILDGLPHGTSENQYQAIDHFLHTIHLERALLDRDSDKTGTKRSESLIFTNIPEATSLRDIHSSTETLLSRSFTSYDPVLQDPPGQHEDPCPRVGQSRHHGHVEG